MKTDQQAKLSEQAWALCEEALATGHLTLSNGKVVDITSPDKEEQAAARNLLTHLRWLASLTAKRKARTEMPRVSDEFRVPESQ